MGHGTPLATAGDDACDAADPHMLDVDISSIRHIAQLWVLLPARDERAAAARKPRSPKQPVVPDKGMASAGRPGPGAIIEDALHAAGSMMIVAPRQDNA